MVHNHAFSTKNAQNTTLKNSVLARIDRSSWRHPVVLEGIKRQTFKWAKNCKLKLKSMLKLNRLSTHSALGKKPFLPKETCPPPLRPMIFSEGYFWVIDRRDSPNGASRRPFNKSSQSVPMVYTSSYPAREARFNWNSTELQLKFDWNSTEIQRLGGLEWVTAGGPDLSLFR